MTDVADGFGQVVQVVKALVVALELGHILGPWCQDEQGAGSTAGVGVRRTEKEKWTKQRLLRPFIFMPVA